MLEEKLQNICFYETFDCRFDEKIIDFIVRKYMSINYDYVLGTLCIVVGLVIVMVVLGELLLRVIVSLAALSLINYGLRLKGLPSLQLLLPLMVGRKRWF